MRSIFIAALLLAGCARLGASTDRPSTVFPPNPDEETQAGRGDQQDVWILEHRINHLHPGCYAVQRNFPKGSGIIRCGIGQLEWTVTRDNATGLDDYDILKEALKDDAERAHAKLEDREVDCTLVGAPGNCHMYVYRPADGSGAHATIVGVSQLVSKDIVAQCVSNAGDAEAMRPVCGEIFEIKN